LPQVPAGQRVTVTALQPYLRTDNASFRLEGVAAATALPP
jgi:hypothetical protein